MTVIVAENTPDKVRGLLKRWFIEPKPNVFVGSVNSRTRDKVLQYILKYSPEDMALLVICDDRNSQGFRVFHFRDPQRREHLVSGHYLLAIPPEIIDISTAEPAPGPSEADQKAVEDILSQARVSYDLKN